jgi:signal transduction histidine kinase
MDLKFANGAQNRNRFSRLGMWYAIALGIIAAVAIAGQVLIQSHLSSQSGDSRVINIAGKQRMLSQEISKISLLLTTDMQGDDRLSLLRRMKESVAVLERSHRGLQLGDDSLRIPANNHPSVIRMFSEVDGHFLAIRESAQTIIAQLEADPLTPADSLKRAAGIILANEGHFLSGMENIASWFALRGERKVQDLSRMEYILLLISLFVILMEVIFIFRPTAGSIHNTVTQLMASEKNARKLLKEIGALYSSLEKSYEQVAMVNQPVENPRLLARADRGGNITSVTDHYTHLAGTKEVTGRLRISDLFEEIESDDDWMDEVIETVSDGQFWQGELQLRNLQKEKVWVMVVITPVYNEREEVDALLLVGSDITQRKIAEQNMRRKNRAEIEKKINQQKFRSVLILEGQEEERNRIAMDIHDGIGQMLTSLKYQIESIDPRSGEKAEQKIAEVDQLIKQVIREVRRVTFNLKPTVLGDYGLQAALNVFVQETAKLVDVRLVYKTSGELERLPQKIENNIFRIIQEAINNAIKYSEADLIEISLSQVDDNLVITVKDEGKGFDTRLVEARSVNIESGRGFFNMYERTEYVNGKLLIQSTPGRGTTVTLVVPVKNSISMEV